MKDALYIGSVVADNIALKPKGKSSIEMIFDSSKDGTVSVDVTETDNPSNEYHLAISLNSLEEDKRNYPDFESGFESGGNKARVKRQKRDWGHRRKIPWVALILGALILAGALLVLWVFLFKGGLPPVQKMFQKSVQTVQKTVQKFVSSLPSTEKTAPKTETGKPVPEASAVAEPLIIERPPDPSPPPPVAEPPAPAETPAAPAAASPATAPAARTGRTPNRINAPRTIPPEGVIYKVRWGDTLWDISAAFYRNPRLYTFIARSNGISNPSRIISGTELTILPRN